MSLLNFNQFLAIGTPNQEQNVKIGLGIFELTSTIHLISGKVQHDT